MFDVKQSVENKTDKPVTLYPWSLVVRYGQPPAEGIYILHEGPYGVFNGSLKEFSYSDFKDNKQQKIATTGGWVGITDKYWMAALVPEQKQKVDVTIKQTGSGAEVKYQIDYVAPGQAIAPGASATTDAKLFAGAKIVRIISDYERSTASRSSTSRSTGAGSGSSPSRCSGCSSGSTCSSATSACRSWC